jgi:LuxR family maltose regulon positive regulatory protein
MAMILDANALEYLPLMRGFEARLDLLRGETERAIAWLDFEDGVSIEATSLDAFDHPYLTRVKVLLAEGSAESLERAQQAIATFLAVAEERCQAAHQIEALALAAMVCDAQGRPDEALATMRRSVELAAPSGGVRIYRDLGARAGFLLARLADQSPDWPFLQELAGGREAFAPGATFAAMPELLTPREAEVLAGLARRLSYQEIGDQLFISMETVKSHTSRIYGKLGVSSRREAIQKAESLGWLSPI